MKTNGTVNLEILVNEDLGFLSPKSKSPGRYRCTTFEISKSIRKSREKLALFQLTTHRRVSHDIRNDQSSETERLKATISILLKKIKNLHQTVGLFMKRTGKKYTSEKSAIDSLFKEILKVSKDSPEEFYESLISEKTMDLQAQLDSLSEKLKNKENKLEMLSRHMKEVLELNLQKVLHINKNLDQSNAQKLIDEKAHLEATLKQQQEWTDRKFSEYSKEIESLLNEKSKHETFTNDLLYKFKILRNKFSKKSKSLEHLVMVSKDPKNLNKHEFLSGKFHLAQAPVLHHHEDSNLPNDPNAPYYRNFSCPKDPHLLSDLNIPNIPNPTNFSNFSIPSSLSDAFSQDESLKDRIAELETKLQNFEDLKSLVEVIINGSSQEACAALSEIAEYIN